MLKNHETRKRQSRDTNPALAHCIAQILNHVYIILFQFIAGVEILYLPEHSPFSFLAELLSRLHPPRLGPSLQCTAAQEVTLNPFLGIIGEVLFFAFDLLHTVTSVKKTHSLDQSLVQMRTGP